MGFYFRKSVRFGPVRVNFSKSGIGLSAGIKGLRVGTGPRGNYVRAGANGFYYRAALPGGRSHVPARIRTPLSPATLPQCDHAPIPDNTLAAFAAIESGDAERMVDSSSEALLEEIRHKHKSVRSWPWAAGVLCGATMWAIQNGLPSWVVGLSLFFGLAITTLAYRWDVQRKLTILHYDLDSRSIEAYGRLVDASTRIAECAQIWHVRGRRRFWIASIMQVPPL